MRHMPIATQNPAPSAPGRPRPDGPPSTPATPVAAPAAIQALQTQLIDLNIQATSLRATLRGLNRQLNSMRVDNPARPALQQQAADVGAQLAQVEGKMAELQARIAQQQGVPVERIGQTGQIIIPSQGGPPFSRGVDPDMVIGLSFVLAMCFVLPISIGIAKRMWRGKPQPPAVKLDDISPRLERLEQAVDSIAIEIERISEGQRFVTKILAERPAEEKPVLALGAGPAEPIRVNERQGVKQANTPR